jgi:hypothetical protein
MSSDLNDLIPFYSYPIEYNMVGDKIELKNNSFVFDNGLKINLYDFLQNPRDIKFNKKTGIVLTSVLSSTDIFKDKNTPKNVSDLKFIQSPISDNNSFVSTISTINNFKRLFRTNQKSFNSENTFKFIVDEKEKNVVYVESSSGDYLTYSLSLNPNLYFSSKISPPSDNQKFNFFLGKNNIILFPYSSNYTQIVRVNGQNLYECITANFSLNSQIPFNSIIYFTSYLNNSFYFDTVKNSYFARYESSPILNQKEIIPTEESRTENYKQNYLGFFPYENLKLENDKVIYDFQIHGLKNYQTAEYNYSRGFQYLKDLKSIRREYFNIFSGTNQSQGSENVCLGYTTNTYEKTFLPDQSNIFYFPPTTNRIPLSSCGLIEDGAYAGDLPFVSDRIFMKQMSYEEITPSQPQPQSITRWTGTWLCSWLYKQPNGESIWMDRYYNSAYYTLDQALMASVMVYNNEETGDGEYDAWDEPSKMYLEPGVQYMYYRTGQENAKNFLNYLIDDFYNPLGSKILDVENFNTSPLIDESKYKNNGLLFLNKEENFKNDYIILDGSNHIVFPAKNSLLEKNNLTVSLWLDVDDWNNITGDQIIGNYYESGFGLINDSAVTAPLFTVVDSTSGVIYNLNYKLNQTENLSLPVISNSKNFIIQRLTDFTYWVIDVQNRIIRKYGIEGKILIEKTINSSGFQYIDQVEIDSAQRLHLFDSKNRKIVRLDANGNILNTITTGVGYKRIEIDLNDNIVYSYGEASCIDNNNILWQVIGSNLYKNDQIYANIGPVQQISCDTKNNLWIVHQKDKLTKLNLNTNIFEFTKSIGRNSLIDDDCFIYEGQFRFIDFIKAPKTGKSCIETIEKNEDLTILVDDSDKIVYLYNSEGLLISTVNLYSLFTNDISNIGLERKFKALGDFSSYQYLRKYSSSNKALSWKFKIAYANGTNAELKSLTYDISNISPGWHNFVFCFDSTNGKAQYYIDTFLVDEVNFEKAKYQIQYDYRSSILVGAANIKNTSLNDLIKIDDAYKLIGRIGRILFYNKFLTKGEIEQIYYSSNFSKNKGELNWNISLGERNYVEEIQHWFQMQLPSNKSKYYNINIHNLNADDEVKKIIENAIKNNIKKITPAHTDLYKINWLNTPIKQQISNIIETTTETKTVTCDPVVLPPFIYS